MEGELVAAIHAGHEGAALVVDGPIHPGARMGDQVMRYTELTPTRFKNFWRE
jgi:hypothetical protein